MIRDRITRQIVIAFGIVVLLFVVVVGAIVGFGIYMTWDKDFSKKYEAKQAEGREFGKQTDQKGCMEEALSRSKAMGFADINEITLNGGFVEECLKASRPTPGFCDGVPSKWSPNDTEWSRKQCEKAGLDDIRTGCVSVFKEKIDFCGK